MTGWERGAIIGIAGTVSLLATGTVCYAAVQALASGDGGLQNLLFGGLIGTGAFGAATLMSLLQSRDQRGAGSGQTTIAEAESVTVGNAAAPPKPSTPPDLAPGMSLHG